jgi:hypothetical protein
MEAFQIPFRDYSALAAAVKAALNDYGGGLVYGNEGGWYNSGFCKWPAVKLLLELWMRGLSNLVACLL